MYSRSMTGDGDRNDRGLDHPYPRLDLVRAVFVKYYIVKCMTMHGMVVRLMIIVLIPVLNRAPGSNRYIDLFRMMMVGDQVMAQENCKDN